MLHQHSATYFPLAVSAAARHCVSTNSISGSCSSSTLSNVSSHMQPLRSVGASRDETSRGRTYLPTAHNHVRATHGRNSPRARRSSGALPVRHATSDPDYRALQTRAGRSARALGSEDDAHEEVGHASTECEPVPETSADSHRSVSSHLGVTCLCLGASEPNAALTAGAPMRRERQAAPRRRSRPTRGHGGFWSPRSDAERFTSTGIREPEACRTPSSATRGPRSSSHAAVTDGT